MNPLFIINFEDGTNYVGGNTYKETGWMNIPDKKIKSIFYRLPNIDYLCLSGYEKYFHMIEATVDLNGKEKGKEKICYTYIMGKIEDKVISYKIFLQNNIVLVNRLVMDYNSDYIQKLNKEGWRG